jgi:hypothetical protein
LQQDKISIHESSFPYKSHRERFNETRFETLNGKALKKVERLVNQNGSINISGQYGSIEINEEDLFLHNLVIWSTR